MTVICMYLLEIIKLEKKSNLCVVNFISKGMEDHGGPINTGMQPASTLSVNLLDDAVSPGSTMQNTDLRMLCRSSMCACRHQ